ncbi:MAG: ATP-grasp domain-containing protein [Candidatus Omnitrophica bacterium]|nr:ATP-grasp domain-containing protein [Candidatus Omnitrophota bacterium]
MRIGITFNLKSDLPTSHSTSQPDDFAEEFDSPETIEAIQTVLTEAGHEVHLLGGSLTTLEQIKRLKIEFVFNMVEGFRGRCREAHIPALLEMLEVPYSGSDPLGLAATLDKSFAKRIAISLDIATPKFWVLDSKEDLSPPPPVFPLFVKPLWEGSSKGIRFSSRVENPNELEREVSRIFRHYPEVPVLVEEYIQGREFTVGVIGNPPEILGIMEIKFRDPKKKDFCYSIEVKRNWKKEVEYIVPPNLETKKLDEIQKAALQLFKALRLRDVGRFDFRMNADGKFYFLEVNPLPGLSPESGDIVILAQRKGLSYATLILKILNSAFSRYPALNPNLKGGIHVA